MPDNPIRDELDALDELHARIDLDQSAWQVDRLESGELGLVRHRQVDDYVWCEATAEVDDAASRTVIVRGLIVSCHDPLERRETRHASIRAAAAAASDMLRWAWQRAGQVPAENYREE